MNTKFFLLLLVSLLLAASTNAAATHGKKGNFGLFAGKAQTQKNTPHEAKESTQNTAVSAWMRVVARTKKDDYVIDDDGKFHQVHYHRITPRRTRRMICICLSAGLLTIVYVCTLIANYLHMIH